MYVELFVLDRNRWNHSTGSQKKKSLGCLKMLSTMRKLWKFLEKTLMHWKISMKNNSKILKWCAIYDIQVRDTTLFLMTVFNVFLGKTVNWNILAKRRETFIDIWTNIEETFELLILIMNFLNTFLSLITTLILMQPLC